jgi:hypothetical protein
MSFHLMQSTNITKTPLATDSSVSLRLQLSKLQQIVSAEEMLVRILLCMYSIREFVHE